MDVNKKLSSLQEISKAQLSKILNVSSQVKHLVLEPSLIRPLEKVCGVKWLKANGVDKIFKLEATPSIFTPNNIIVYMIFSTCTIFHQVVDQIRSKIDIENPPKNPFHIIVVPRVTHNFERDLERLGLLNSVIKLHSFQWMPIYLDTGILSLEIPNVFRQLFVHNDTTVLPNLSKCLWQLFFVVGKPKFMLALGQFSNALLMQYENLCLDRGDSDKFDSDFGSLIIIDRNVDYASALLTSGTYSALLSEIYETNAGGSTENKTDIDLEVKFDKKCNPIIEKKFVNFTLDSSVDPVYADIKDRYFTEVTSVLSNLTKQLKIEKNSFQDMELEEMKSYVQKQLQNTKDRKKFISNHFLVAESIINIVGPRYENQTTIEQNIMKNTNKSLNLNYLDEILNTQADSKLIALRLFCLISLAQKLSDNETKLFWRKFLQHFGFHYGFVYENLTNCGFITQPSATVANSKLKLPKFTTSNFHTNAKALKQIPPDPDKINLKYPTCASYVFRGSYIPLITQIVNLLLNSTPMDEVKAKLEGLGPYTLKNDRGYPLQSRTVLVYVVGGVTYAEIAACHLLEAISGSKIVVLSDKIITGNHLMQGLMEFPK